MNKEGVMSKESGLVGLLDAELCRGTALLRMQISIEEGVFDAAMMRQFEYLYWNDEFIELLEKNHEEYLALRVAALGIEW